MHDQIGEIGKLLDNLPIISLIFGGDKERPILTRLLEQGIIAAAAAFIALYISNQIQDHDITLLTAEVHRLSDRIDKIYGDLYVPRGVK